MRRGEVFFHPMEGSGQLSISWSSAPKGAAIEAKNGNGVGFFSANGDLLSVIFDDVLAEEDHQVLEFAKHRIEVTVRNGKTFYKLHKAIPSKNKLKRSTTRKSLPVSKKPARKAGRTKKA